MQIKCMEKHTAGLRTPPCEVSQFQSHSSTTSLKQISRGGHQDLRHLGSVVDAEQQHDVEKNPGPPRSLTSTIPVEQDGVLTITGCLNFLRKNKRELDVNDVSSLGKLLLCFQWPSELVSMLRKRLGKGKKAGPGRGWEKKAGQLQRKIHHGPGRGKRKAKEQIQLDNLNESQLSEVMLKSSSLATSEMVQDMLSRSDKERWAWALAKSIKEDQYLSSQRKRERGLRQISSVTVEESLQRVHPVVKSFVQGMASEYVKEKVLSLIIIEINDRLLKLCNNQYISPFSFRRNYALLKMTGSNQCVNILAKTDGSGHYNTLRQEEKESAKEKEMTVCPADVDITADNEQVLSKNYRISGDDAQRKLSCNVINNWQASYFCSEDQINRRGIQADRSLQPDWMTMPQKEKLEECKNFPEDSIQPLREYARKCLQEEVESQLADLDGTPEDEIDIKIKRNPVKLSGRPHVRICQECETILPDKGTGSRKCQDCGKPWKEIQKSSDNVFSRRKQNKSRCTRAEFFKHFMLPGKSVALENVAHSHSIQPIIHQMPAMYGNPSSLENIKNHLRCYGSFARVPRYCQSDENYSCDRDESLEHEWFYLTTDGKPRLLIINLQENCYRCMNPRCGYRVALGYGFESLCQHLWEVHGEEVSMDKEQNYHSWREFDFVLSLSGRGHKEKNMISTLIEFHFETVMEHLLESIGFVTAAQKLLIRKAKDHHKAWDFLMIITEALDKELGRAIAQAVKRRNAGNHQPSIFQPSDGEQEDDLPPSSLHLKPIVLFDDADPAVQSKNEAPLEPSLKLEFVPEGRSQILNIRDWRPHSKLSVNPQVESL